MNGKQRADIRPGMRVAIVLKQDQRTCRFGNLKCARICFHTSCNSVR
ncbi:MAG: YwbE family protein [Acidobacteria bacterium]|nr:YwbE family protein [Acidobacteriota bacterium]